MAATYRESNETTEKLYELTLEGTCDAECGDVNENGYWYGLIRFGPGEDDVLGLSGMAGAIVEQDSYGFKGHTAYATDDELDAAWVTCEQAANGEEVDDDYYA